MVTKLKPVDIVVIGVGVAGSLACKGLAETGLKVVGLERGRMVDSAKEFVMPAAHDEFRHHSHDPDWVQDLSRETITFRNAVGDTALPIREYGSFKPGQCVGGAGIRWGGRAYRFLPWDFETRSRTIERYGKSQIADDCTSQDWGISYEELEPYYDQFEHIYGIGGKAGNINGEIQPGGNPFEGPRSREYPNPPTKRTYVGTLFAEAAASFGYKPFQGPTASMTQPYTNLYRLTLGQCVYGGYCNGYGCTMGAKATPLTAVLPALLKHENFELRTRANVTRINLDSEKRRAVSVTYIDARGREVEQPADLVVLASYTLNNTRLLLLSGIGKPYDPVRNIGVVGKNYSYQTTGRVSLFFEDKVFNRFIGTNGLGTVIDEFNGDNFDHSGLGFIGGGFISAYSQGDQPMVSHPVPPSTPNWGCSWKQAVAKYYDKTFTIRTHGACQSFQSNYLDLDPNYRDANGLPLLRMTFDFGENDRAMQRYVTGKAMEIAKVIQPSQTSMGLVTGKYSIEPYQSTHNCGGTVMGTDPSASTVNKYLQSWDVSNVFVFGASAFPQNSANNPTVTVGALTCWATDEIKERYLKNPGSLA